MAANLMSLKAQVLSHFYTVVSTLHSAHYTLYTIHYTRAPESLLSKCTVHLLGDLKNAKGNVWMGDYRVGKSPLLAKFLPVTLTIHWASLSCLALSSSALAHCLRLPAWPCPSPTKTSRSSKQRTFARITADESRRRRRPVTIPSSLEDSGLPLLRPKWCKNHHETELKQCCKDRKTLFSYSNKMTYNWLAYTFDMLGKAPKIKIGFI